MNIISIKNCPKICYKSVNKRKTDNLSYTKTPLIQKNSNFLPGYPLPAFLGVKKFEPVIKQENIGLIDDYSNIDSFCQKLVQKLDSQALNPTEKDIDSLVLELELETKAPKKTILEVLYKLTQFSSFSSIETIEKTLDKNKAKIMSYVYPTLNINHSLDYILNQKFNLNEKYQTSLYGAFLDDNLLKSFENNEFENNFMAQCYFDATEALYYLDGSEIKGKDGIYYNNSFLVGSGYLKYCAKSVIEKIQDGANLDEAINGDFLLRAKKISDFKGKRLVIIKKDIPENEQDLKSGIVKNLQSKTPDVSAIKATIEKYANKKQQNSNDNLRAIAQYLDMNAQFFSPLRLQKLSVDKFKQIKNCADKTKRNLYYIPEAQKSTAYINYMFLRSNKINPKNVIFNFEPDKVIKNKNIIFIDDLALGGNSLNEVVSDYKYIESEVSENCNLYLAPFSALSDYNPQESDSYCFLSQFSEGKNLIKIPVEEEIYNFKDSKEEQRNLLNYLFGSSYGNYQTCIYLPYMLPDNNSKISAQIFGDCLYKNTRHSNKGLF